MVEVRLSYANFFARDVTGLAQFYIDALGLEEVEASRDHRYREVRAGGCMIGFAQEAAREMLNLGDEADPTGLRSIIVFDIGSAAALDGAVDKAVAHGATLMKPPYDSPWGLHQAVLRDPEGNAFRLGAPVGT